MTKCLDELTIAETRTGFTDDWYDALNMDNKFHSYYFTTPSNTDDFYITAETYSENIVPVKCTKASATTWGEYAEELTSPLVTIVVYKAGATDQQFKKVAA